ncbi:peptidyl-prolyl cis-trans isomerase [Pseudonocardia sp. H11422]|uniref:peptidylprolyl isomerase n=1 Tax=Pseudonocardia sp. H11422 TaxID=2835866 RepID=UPI001BDCB9D6|nr:peptidylprolyl isomerase [Pseudonocardia sp. H11422]
MTSTKTSDQHELEAAPPDAAEAAGQSLAAAGPSGDGPTAEPDTVGPPFAEGGSRVDHDHGPPDEPAEGGAEPHTGPPPPRGRAAVLIARIRALRPPASLRGRICLAAALTVLLLAGAGGAAWWWTERLPDGVAYRVAGHDVTVAELDREIEALGALYGIRPPDSQTDPAAFDTFRRDMAKASAIGRVVDAATAEHGIVIADRAVQDVLGRYVEQYFGTGTGDAARRDFVTALGNSGTSERAVMQELTRQMAASRLFEQVTAPVSTVTDTEVDTAFAERRDALATPERRTLSNIVVADEATALQVREQLDSGAVFADVARARSADASSRDQGGAIGTLAAANLEQEYAAAAFAAAEGSVFGPVRTSHGWNVGLVGAVVPAAPADPAALREPLRAQLLAERRNDAWRAFLSDALANAGVRFAENYRPADPDALPPAPAPVGPAR